jgi:glycosyltransferase involved in cell wall biosynthesis
MAARSQRVRMLGAVWDQELLDELYANARTYIHGHSVGGTNPSLLRAMGAAAPVLAFDVGFNREVVGPQVRVFSTPGELAALVQQADSDFPATLAYGQAGQRVAAQRYRWDDVADRYCELLERLVGGYTIHGPHRRRRTSVDVGPETAKVSGGLAR